jgi:hypothetical protein
MRLPARRVLTQRGAENAGFTRERLQVFVDCLSVRGRAIDVYAVASEGAVTGAHYAIYSDGVCLNPSEPFWRLPTVASIEAHLLGAGASDPAPAQGGRVRRAHCSVDQTRRRAAH